MSLRKALTFARFPTSIHNRLTFIFIVVFGLFFLVWGFVFCKLVLEPQGGPLNFSSQQFLTLVIFSIAILAAAGFSASQLAKSALRPLNQLIGAVDRINGQALSARFEIPSSDSELQRLVSTLNGMMARLEEAFRVQEEFLGHASHELKTPLAIIKGELDVLRQKTRTPEQVEQFFASASEELTHLGRLVANLLLLTRIQSGLQTYNGAVTELEDVVMNELPWLNRLGKRNNVRISVNMIGLDEALLNQTNRVNGEPELLGCMISNIVENAIKYSSANSAITLNCDFQPSRFVELSVRDSGSGIAPEVLPQIFDRFYRNPEVNERVHGTGLGLALVRQIARLYQCHLNVKSAPGTGTTFLIKFPKSSIVQIER